MNDTIGKEGILINDRTRDSFYVRHTSFFVLIWEMASCQYRLASQLYSVCYNPFVKLLCVCRCIANHTIIGDRVWFERM